MRLKNSILFDVAFAGAFKKLMKVPLPGTVALRILETFKVLNEQQTNVFAVKDQLLQRCVELKDGRPLVIDNQIQWLSAESQREFETEMNSLSEMEFVIPLEHKIELSDKILISGEEILALKPIIDIDI